VNIVQLMFPEGDWNGPLAAGCATGAGGGVTVTVTVGVESGVGAGIGAGAIVATAVGADVDADAGVSDAAWTVVEPADDEHPTTVTAARATGHTRRCMMRCGWCGFLVMPVPSRQFFVGATCVACDDKGGANVLEDS
jgi:hypothetical protein